ncbi:MAG: hypothetical protein V1775_00640 [Bacteroidota bacterium]
MRESKVLKIIMLIALRVGIIAFLFAFFYELIGESDSMAPFWEDVANVVTLLLVTAASVILLVLDKRKFEVFGFFLVFVISLYRLFLIVFLYGFRHEMASHFLLIILSLYMLIKPFKKKQRTGVGFLE